jgi:hypothetical protein
LLDRRLRTISLASWSGIACFGAGVIATNALHLRGWLIAPGLAGFALAFVSITYAHLVGLRCPRCGGNLAPLLLRKPGLRTDASVRVCPYCSVALDAPLERRID